MHCTSIPYSIMINLKKPHLQNKVKTIVQHRDLIACRLLHLREVQTSLGIQIYASHHSILDILKKVQKQYNKVPVKILQISCFICTYFHVSPPDVNANFKKCRQKLAHTFLVLFQTRQNHHQYILSTGIFNLSFQSTTSSIYST